MSSKGLRILYIDSAVVPPPRNAQRDMFFFLSNTLEGDVLRPVWFTSKEQVEALYGPEAYPIYTVGRFRYHWFLAWQHRGLRRKLGTFWFYISTGWRLLRRTHYDSIVSYSHMTTALCGALLKALTRTPFVSEVVTMPDRSYMALHPRPTWKDRAMHIYSCICLNVTIRASDRVHLLYPSQLMAYPSLQKVPASVFHAFVPTSAIKRHCDTGRKAILLVGAPWYLKGIDILVSAFMRVAPEFPDVCLKLLGHYPEISDETILKLSKTRIEVLRARSYAETLDIISEATVVALPSRCEGMGRVLLEAMAAGVPVIGSNLGGIPVLVRHGQNGFLIPTENIDELEARLRDLLSDERLQEGMGACGWHLAHSAFNENSYVEAFTRMILDAAGQRTLHRH
jgi:glycosyltransferase involved in cell wall biosynthesis